MSDPVISDPQQDILAETVNVVADILSADPNSQLAGMDAVRQLMADNGTDLGVLETHLRTTGHNDPTLVKLEAIIAGIATMLTQDELNTIMSLSQLKRPPSFSYALAMDFPGQFIAWNGNTPFSGLELHGRLVGP